MSEVNNEVNNEIVNNEVNNEIVEGSEGTRAHNMSLEVIDVKQKQKRGRKIKYITEEDKINARRQQQPAYRERKKNEMELCSRALCAMDKLKGEIEELKKKIELLEKEHASHD